MVLLDVKLKQGWTDMWSAISSGWPGLATVMTWVGVGLLVMSVVGWLYQKRRGGGGNSSGLLWAVILGAVLSAPSLLIPAILGIFDFVVNILVSLLAKAGT